MFAVQPKQRVRFRMANIGSTYEMRVRLDGHRMAVIAIDGIPTMPSTVDSVTLDVGERCDLIVEMSQPVGNYWLRASTLDPKGQDGVRAIVRYAGAPAVEPAATAASWGTELDYNALRARGGTPVPAPDLVGTHLLGGTMKPFEWSYSMQVARWLTVQPDVQYIVKPGGSRNSASRCASRPTQPLDCTFDVAASTARRHRRAGR